MSRQHFEQAHNFGKEVNSFFARRIIRRAAGVQSRNTSLMRLSLVVPECFITLIIRNPVSLHIIQSRSIALCGEKLGDVLVCAVFVAVFAVSAVKIVGPKSVNCLRI